MTLTKPRPAPAMPKSTHTVLVVDDETDFRRNVVRGLKRSGFRVLEAASGGPALELAQRHTVDVALVDLVMSGMNGLELMRELLDIDELTRVILLTGEGSVESAVNAMRQGATDYLSKPLRLTELQFVVEKVCANGRMARENRAYRVQQARGQHGETTTLIAESSAMREIVRKAGALGSMEMPVLILGETGTGKEVVAGLIHDNSDHANMPLTVLNCAAIPDTLIDAELFGHEKGTYTGATDARPGMIEIADGGTLLLDEIGDMPLGAQTRLLRFLENGTIRRVGGRVDKSVNVRVLATTNRELPKAILNGEFREDLYHRLKGFELVIPPLRERVEDILPFTRWIVERQGGRHRPSPTLGAAAADTLTAYSWPGNMRELRHTVERSVFSAVMDGAHEIRPEHLHLPEADHSSLDLDSVVRDEQRRHIRKVLAMKGGNRREAAEILKISERQLYRLLQDAEPAVH